MSLENFYEHSLKSGVFLLLLLGCGHATSNCTNGRCLADMVISKASLSQPQEDDCRHIVEVISLKYQTLSVDTKNLILNVRLTLTLKWDDPTLAWNTLEHNINDMALPVKKIWVPEIQVANGLQSTMKHSTKDVTVKGNGTVLHEVIVTAGVKCVLNMFNYPFASDECPVGLRTWTFAGCGTNLKLNMSGGITMVDSSRGDWETESVESKSDYYASYIMVSLKIRHFNPFITLMLPTILIFLADAVGFYLPLSGGERNCFKVTLVLSLVVLLTILDEKLPGGSECSPVIRLHYCVCMVMLVVSMLVSMVLTGMATEGLIVCRCAKKCASKKGGDGTDQEDEETKADISVIQLNGPQEEKQMLREVVNFLEGIQAKEKKNKCRHSLANTLDKIFFWLYLIGGTSYFCAMICVMATYHCKVSFNAINWSYYYYG